MTRLHARRLEAIGCLAALMALAFRPVALAEGFLSFPLAVDAAASTDSASDEQARIASDGRGNWLAIWYSHEDPETKLGVDGDILCSHSADNGRTWSPARAVNTNAARDFVGDFNPTVAATGEGAWLAVWYSFDSMGDPAIGSDADIFFAHSADNGATWTDPEPLNTNARTDIQFDATPKIATDGQGNWLAAWRSNDPLEGKIGFDADILNSRSGDNGRTWSPPAPLNSNATGDLLDEFDINVALATDEAGHWVAVWETQDRMDGAIGFDRDLLVARSDDLGVTWSDARLLNSNATFDSGHDFNPSLATDGLGTWIAVWHSNDPMDGMYGSDNDIYSARSFDNGATWTDLEAINPNADGDVYNDVMAWVATDRSGLWFVAWQTFNTREFDLFLRYSVSAGERWMGLFPLNVNGEDDTGSDHRPRIATDRAGHWVAVWESNDPVGGAYGRDRDTFATSFCARNGVDSGAWSLYR